MPRCHAAIDLETLATTPDAKIISIGVVAVCEDTGAQVKFYSVVNLNSQGNSRTSASTLKWWSDQSAEARVTFDEAHSPDAPNITDVLNQLTEWFGQLGQTHTVYPYGNGATFDISILEYAFAQYTTGTPPWNFRNTRDMRTLYDLTLRLGITANAKRTGTHHNALDDAQFQSDIIMDSLKQVEVLAQMVRTADELAESMM